MEITYDDVLKFISDQIKNTEDFEDWDLEVETYIENLKSDLILEPQR